MVISPSIARQLRVQGFGDHVAQALPLTGRFRLQSAVQVGGQPQVNRAQSGLAQAYPVLGDTGSNRDHVISSGGGQPQLDLLRVPVAAGSGGVALRLEVLADPAPARALGAQGQGGGDQGLLAFVGFLVDAILGQPVAVADLADPLILGALSFQGGAGPLVDDLPFKLRDGRKDREDQSPSGGRRVDVLRETFEPNAAPLYRLHGFDQRFR